MESHQWVKIRENFYKSDEGKYHICGRHCDKVPLMGCRCPISGMVIRKSHNVSVRAMSNHSKRNTIYSVLWESIMDGTRDKLHKQVITRLKSRKFSRRGSLCSLEMLLLLESEYHRLNKSYAPFCWPLLRSQPNVVSVSVDKIASLIEMIYANRSLNLVNFDFRETVRNLARIISEGVMLRQNIVMFPRNYLWVSLLPPPKDIRSSIRTKLLRLLRTSSSWRELSYSNLNGLCKS